MQKILKVTSSVRKQESISNQLSMMAAQEIQQYLNETEVIPRDLSNTELPLINNQWLDAYYTEKSQRSADQLNLLKKSDSLINEFKNSQILIIGMPIYNFGMPAALKAYFDLICRADATFKITKDGHIGLLVDRPTYIVVTSNSIEINNKNDYATPHLVALLNLIGIHDIQLINATRLKSENVGKRIASATHKIEQFIFQHYGEPATEIA